ncbi:MAG: hypothetical protein A2286_05145 [Gammaproteobacteria bacterium RIFOXYA12_FULL_61_12]|nr:MAG: hypothetical protein A2514_01660 [Gammaproteobacteria bacterium RIFOXYD12_FULL_61_37]OGT93703.1 MAG: hypothetical protein A2286_05145 [Gammaproteobacteria bacterium RIFOXYA12_FULL_61_12]
MTILQEIQKWSVALPSWQQDAIVRLFNKGKLDIADFDDLYALLKSAHAISDPIGRVASKLAAGQVTAPQAANSVVRLTALKNLRHVNALAEKQTLTFKEDGLTVIYGNNGSGKSGYTRALKRACRARDQSESIFPNAKLTPNQVGKPEAEFDLVINGQPITTKWEDGTPALDALSNIAIFDSRCARAYLDEEGDFAYVPYGLDILEELAKACAKLKAMLDEEGRKNAVSSAIYAHLANSSTVVGKLITSLSGKTKPAAVEALVTLSNEEETKRLEIETSLKEGNPKDRAQQLTLLSGRFANLAKRCTDTLAFVNETEVTILHGLIDASKAARAAADIAANQFKQTPGQLPGTGGTAWQELFEAAKKFAAESHIGEEFPHLKAESQCPLCQQTLGDAAERIVTFDAFIQQEAEKLARDKKAEAVEKYNAIVKADLTISMEPELRTEINAADEALAKACNDFQAGLTSRQISIKKACGDGAWDLVSGEPVNPASKLVALANQFSENAATLLQAADENARIALEKELKELNDRFALSQAKAAVLDAIAKFDYAAKLKSCEADVKTNAITIKSNELNEQVVSKNLADELNAEFKLLGVDELHVDISTKVVKGKANHKLVIKLPGAKLPKDILSEGEQRAIAIASFFAEVNVGSGLGGIVFDDPVSSLDHQRRSNVVQRLVQEASKRQVIVFTHDLYFMCLIEKLAAQAQTPCVMSSLRRTADGFGVAVAGIPFDGSPVKTRVKALRAIQGECLAMHKAGNTDEASEKVRHCYGLLRMAWERAVEELLLNGVIWRFDTGVSTQALREVAVEDSDYHTIYAAMSKSSSYAAHDGAAIAQVATPHPDVLGADIDALEVWRVATEARKAKLRENRPK